MPDRVLVTGISGFVGGHVALQLLQAGYIVRGSVRSLDKADRVRDTLSRAGADVSRLEFVALDLLRDDDWADAMAGIRYLQHVASPFVTRMPRDSNDLIRPAVEGTRRALENAFAAGVERVVLTSSVAAILYGHDAGRTAPFGPADWTVLGGRNVNAYVESKTRAERTAWEIAARLGRTGDLVSINPGAIYGPLLDDDPGTTGRLVVEMLRGRMPVTPSIALEAIDVRDVAAAHLAAMTTPDAGGKRFPLGAGPVSLFEAGQALKRAVPTYGGKLPRAELPDWFTRLIGPLVPELRENMGELGQRRQVDASAARALLGRDLTSIDDMFAATARTAIAHGLA